MKKLLAGIGAAVAVLIVVVIARTLMFTPFPVQSGAATPIDVDGDNIAQHLSAAIKFKTISYQPPKSIDTAEFEGFISWLEETYPDVHQSLNKHVLGGYSLLYEWTGKDQNLKPMLLTGHYDVVPVIPGTEDLWERNPWEGDISDGIVWGRGALDDKSAVITIMEAATLLVKEGYQPERTVYLSFGHNEEIGGDGGAGSIAEHLKSQGVQLAWSLDEGSFVLNGMFPGVDRPVASINVAEKGYVTLDLVAHAKGGHSSMPEQETAVGILSQAIVNLQDAPVPGGLDGISAEMMDTLARHFPFSQRVLFANRWLFGGLLESQLSKVSFGNAMLRTTTAPTMLSGSIKENVLPIEAIGTVNFRLHPRDTKESLIAYVKRTINDDRVEIRVLDKGGAASAVSSTEAEGYKAIAQTVTEIFGETIITPGITVAGTDTKHYATVADNSYRFNPMMVGPEDLSGFHGTNERISIDNLALATAYYAQLIKNASATK